MKRKGITPIIAVLVILLITIGIAGSAWTFMSAYWQGLVAKSIQMTDSYCTGGDAQIYLRNSGTNGVSLNNDHSGNIVVLNKLDGEPIAGGEWFESDGVTSLDGSGAAPGELFMYRFTCDIGTMCNVKFIVGGKSIPASVLC